MSNLLLENSRAELRREFRARYLLAGSLLALGAAAFMTLALLPSYVSFSSTLPKEQRSADSEETKQGLADLAMAQALVTQLSSVVTATSTISNAMTAALVIRPRGVHIDDIEYTKADSAGSVAISGLAENREAMNAYRTALQGSKNFTAVKLPVGDLIGTQGGRFNVTLSGSF